LVVVGDLLPLSSRLRGKTTCAVGVAMVFVLVAAGLRAARRHTLRGQQTFTCCNADVQNTA
jgi:hypothetical protein